jgi:hypothetical protein
VNLGFFRRLDSFTYIHTYCADRQVKGTDRGVLLPKDGHQEVAEVALQLGKYCIDDPVKSPLIFGGKKRKLGMPNQLHFCVVILC